MPPSQEPVRRMFNRIAPRYDCLNHLLSFGMDRQWRRRAVSMAKAWRPQSVLDLACGTGDIAIAVLRNLQPQRLAGVDLSAGMLSVCRRKLQRVKGGERVQLAECTAEALPFGPDEFDLITIGFGVRNFSDIPRAMRECLRVLRPGGHLLIIEFSKPRRSVFGGLYRVYSHGVLPLLGGLISGSFASYRYLPRSIDTFVASGILQQSILECGLIMERCEQLTFGIAAITLAQRPPAT